MKVYEIETKVKIESEWLSPGSITYSISTTIIIALNIRHFMQNKVKAKTKFLLYFHSGDFTCNCVNFGFSSMPYCCLTFPILL